MRAVILGVILALTIGCASQKRYNSTGLPSDVLGAAWCTPHTAIIAINMDSHPDNRSVLMTGIHEAIHAIQCRRLGSNMWLWQSRFPRNVLDWEAEAFAYESRIKGMDDESCAVITAFHLEPYKHFHEFPRDTVLAVTRTWCKAQLDY